MSMRTPLGRVEGLGAAHRGTEHFISQRVTAVALVPLAIWFVIFALSLIGADRNDAVAFLSEPVNAIPMALFIVFALMHMKLGLQMVIEDYITGEGGKVVLLFLNYFFALIVGAVSIYALLKIALSHSLS